MLLLLKIAKWKSQPFTKVYIAGIFRVLAFFDFWTSFLFFPSFFVRQNHESKTLGHPPSWLMMREIGIQSFISNSKDKNQLINSFKKIKIKIIYCDGIKCTDLHMYIKRSKGLFAVNRNFYLGQCYMSDWPKSMSDILDRDFPCCSMRKHSCFFLVDW